MRPYRTRVAAKHPKNPPCRFLVPERFQPELKQRLRKQNLDMRGYLKHLLRLARRRPDLLPLKRRITTKYQPNCQQLQKLNFRPEGRDWGEFKTIARGCGVSMCRLFVHLMLLDNDSKADVKAVATSFRTNLREIVLSPGKKVVRILQIRRKPPD
ncbi:MAG: DUF1564 family protein [Spirochaetales bacterium]|nr:DUF1564 family protein [Leptospiraceae bacterium]MCP5483322.1 DUF1564 family protein [Spirochaetales bacterium]MCP5484111.1 DUF1564 family protein [Spirochaetales bacterium]